MANPPQRAKPPLLFGRGGDDARGEQPRARAHTHTHTHKQACTQTNMHACIHAYKHAHTHACIQTCIQTCACGLRLRV